MAKFIYATRASSYLNKMRISLSLNNRDSQDQENCKIINNHNFSKRKSPRINFQKR